MAKKEKVIRLPMGNAPLGPMLPPPKASNVLIFPAERIRRDGLEQSDSKVIYVCFHSRQKMGHVS